MGLGAISVGKHKSSCHPTRLAVKTSTLCRECWQVGRAEAREKLGRVPRRLPGVRSTSFETLPLACPRCHVSSPSWHVSDDGIMASCAICGQDAYLVVP